MAKRRVILMLILAVVSNSAMAKWVELRNDRWVIYFSDPSSISKSGNKVKMMTRMEMLTTGLSYVTQKEFDCEKQQIRSLSLTINGEVSEVEKRSFSVGADISDISRMQWNIACGKQ